MIRAHLDCRLRSTPAGLVLAGLAVAATACVGVRPTCEAAKDASEPVARSASCLVIVDGRVLTIRHRFGGKLGLPGGTSRPHEPARCTAQRETWEETGFIVRVAEPIGPRRDISPVFRCELLPGQAARDRTMPPLQALPEVLGIYWLDPDALPRDDWRSPEQLDWLPHIAREVTTRASASVAR